MDDSIPQTLNLPVYAGPESRYVFVIVLDYGNGTWNKRSVATVSRPFGESGSRSGFLMTKISTKLKNLINWFNIFILRPQWRAFKLRKHQALSVRTSSTNMKIDFSCFVDHICLPPGSESSFPVRIQRPSWIRIQSGSGSRTLNTAFCVGIFVLGFKIFAPNAVLRIRDVYPGSRIRLFSIPDPGSELSPSRIPDPHQRI